MGVPVERVSQSSGDRLLMALALFTIERPQWTVEEAAEMLGVSPQTAYRYFKQLTGAGLITPVAGAGYTLGPAIIQMERQIQATDPMLTAARTVMLDLIQHAVEGSTAILCRLFHDRVMCMHQVMSRGPQEPVSYERGRLMPLYRGATAKIILAHLPTRTLKSLFAHDAAEITAARLGSSFDEFRRALAAIRRAGICVTHGEVDHGRTGFLVDDVKEMAEAIRAADTLDPATCRREAENRFSANRMFEQYLQLYEDVAGGELEQRKEHELCALQS